MGNRLKAQTAAFAHVRLGLTCKCGALWLIATGIRVKPPAMMKCAMNSNKRTCDTAAHQLRQLLATVLWHHLLQCHCSGGQSSDGVRYQGSPCGICGGQRDTGTGFPPSTSGFSYQLSFHRCSTLIYPSSGRWTMGPLEEAVAVGPMCGEDAEGMPIKAQCVHIKLHRDTFLFGTLNFLRW